MFFYHIVCSKREMWEPSFGVYYEQLGCDIKILENIPSWESCSASCLGTPGCKSWTWSHPHSNDRPKRCWLQRTSCLVRNKKDSSNLISGDTTCGKLSRVSTSVPNFGLAYPGCDMKAIVDIRTWERCSQLCHLTPGCQSWTWSQRGLSPYSCWLKKSFCKGIPTPHAISGDNSTYLSCGLPCK